MICIAWKSLAVSVSPFSRHWIGQRNTQNASQSNEKLRTVWRWGHNGSAQHFWRKLLGRTTLMQQMPQNPTIIPSYESAPVTIVSAGYDHAAMIVNGHVLTYGNNSAKQLGRTTEQGLTVDLIPCPVAIITETPFCSVACGGLHTAAITENGLLYTWGWSGKIWSGVGGLGREAGASPMPGLVTQFTEAKEEVCQIACGSVHTLALTKTGKLFATGTGELGRLGLGTNHDHSTFQSRIYTKDFMRCNAFACLTWYDEQLWFSLYFATPDNAEIYVWGRNNYGQLGLDNSLGDMYSHETFPRRLECPELLPEMVKDIICGEHYTVVLLKSGEVYFFGSRLWTTPRRIKIPASVEDVLKMDPLIKLAPGGRECYFVYGLTASGRVLAWGHTGCLLSNVKTLESARILEPAFLPSDALFTGKPVIDISCGRAQVIAITAS